ncbi:hypothetical protein RN001_001388 [Aquatica leii]|uniref:Farnesyl pyrophosphate synthase n=1 Tax=Aquatica leii TaxID=1421715 RepID=A0AAN7PFZ8_9COLE|nr:hypothetical protein RN001_001388 [Aquatica leii]
MVPRDRTSNPDIYKTSTQECMPTFYNLVAELSLRKGEEPVEFSKRINNVLLYNVPRGKRIRVRTLVTTYKILESAENLTFEKLRLAYIMGWCIELLNSSILIDDDIMDASEQRRGAPCWYLVEGVGLRALNDALMVENIVFDILKNHFMHHPCYKDAIELFHKVALLTYLGQALDTDRPKGKTTVTEFYTAEKYNAIVKYKTFYYTLELPVLLALHLSGKYDKDTYVDMRNILSEISYFFQAQNDYMDCFGDSIATGKEGTDIQEGKCTWLIITALEKASPTQRERLEQHYGKTDRESVCNVLDVYRELNIPELYYNYKNNIDRIISSHINKISHIFPELLFTSIADIVCRSTFKK